MPSLGSKTREEVQAARERINKKAPAAKKRIDEKAAKRKAAPKAKSTMPSYPPGAY